MHAPGDQELAKRLRREAKAAAKAQARAELAHTRAARRRARRISRARRRLPVQIGVAGAAALATVPLALDTALWSLSAVASLLAVRSAARLRRPGSVPLPALPPAPVPMPPPVGSSAFPAMRRLEAVREELGRLLPLVAPAGRAAGEQAWLAAAEADSALRWQAARLAALEPHRGVEHDLLRTLEDGVARQERLVGAVADLVAASADPLWGMRLQEATDALHGLAQGLREVRRADRPWAGGGA